MSIDRGPAPARAPSLPPPPVAAGRSQRRWPILVPAWMAIGVLVLPLVALLLRVDWLGLIGDVSSPLALQALRLSAITTSITLVVVLLLGTPLAWVLARGTHRALPWLRALVTVPLVLPPVVGGVALLAAWGRTGVLGGPLDALLGITIPFTTVAVIFAEVFVALPFYVISVEGSMRGLDTRYDQVAATLGASPVRTFTTVVIPLVAPGMAAGAALAWARALGEFGATITFAGNFSGRTQTVPLAVFTALEQDPDAALALSVVMLATCVVVLGALRSRWMP
ncbi:MAG: ABC transporter permease [Ornithinimicrobium sp.]